MTNIDVADLVEQSRDQLLDAEPGDEQTRLEERGILAGRRRLRVATEQVIVAAVDGGVLGGEHLFREERGHLLLEHAVVVLQQQSDPLRNVAVQREPAALIRRPDRLDGDLEVLLLDLNSVTEYGHTHTRAIFH